MHPMTMSAGAPRKFLVGGNWKCNLDASSVAELCATLNAGGPIDDADVEVVVAPPFPYLMTARELLRSDFHVSAQNCWLGKSGAYTGEVTADMIKDCKSDWVILGHSERRNLPLLKETDEAIAEKTAYAIRAGLKVMFCVGELLEEREAGKTLDVCVRQLLPLTKAIEQSEWANVVIAYEPVWAIGTGKVATPDQAEEVHKELRTWISSNVSSDVGDAVRILYGGSVNENNCGDLAVLPDIDGFLVGGCSLKKEFLDIIDSHKSAAAAV